MTTVAHATTRYYAEYNGEPTIAFQLHHIYVAASSVVLCGDMAIAESQKQADGNLHVKACRQYPEPDQASLRFLPPQEEV